ncbi:MAG: hypothetical protein M3N46_03420 [Actinomycetota bacterium]|nr:hypothetical protein [Actinomycetota bacterium]
MMHPYTEIAELAEVVLEESFEVQSLVWSDQGAPPAFDARGQADYGNIDDMVFQGDLYRLGGSWGRMELVAARVTVEYE